MPLHDWANRSGWDGLHHLWITELLRWIKPRLPKGYRAYIGSLPAIALDAPGGRPDVSVHKWDKPKPEPPDSATNGGLIEPDVEVAVATLDPAKALFVEQHGRLVAAVELISPRNKDRPVARTNYVARYVGYLLEGVHLLLVDVHRRPLDFSFADALATQLQMEQPPCPSPLAVSYRVGEPAAEGGRLLAIWQRPLAVAEPLPSLVLPITIDVAVTVDLEQTYMNSAADAYITE